MSLAAGRPPGAGAVVAAGAEGALGWVKQGSLREGGDRVAATGLRRLAPAR